MAYVIISVEKDDNASSLARKYNTTERSLFSLNKPRFYEGERLIIEASTLSRHTVQPFETMKSIAAKYGVSEASLVAANGVSRVFLGQSIAIR